MIIKRYLVSNMNEALTRIRYELGKDAIIISQRKVRKPGVMGFFSGKLIEVTAAVENSSNNDKKVQDDEQFRNSVENLKKAMQDRARVNIEGKSNPSILQNKASYDNKIDDDIKAWNVPSVAKVEENKNDSVHKEVNEIKNLLNKVLENTSKDINEIDEEENVLKETLDELDIDEEFQDELMNSLKEAQGQGINPKEALRKIFEESIMIADSDLNGRIVLVGPTGVGKTTTIAKLAGRLALIEKKKVGLITVDTYRIGAIEQLKTYAEIMNIPFRVIITIKEMEEAIKSMSDCDVVLIDTTGRSSKNTMQISELRAFVQKANPNHVNMVISATTKNRDIKSILEGYSELNYDNVIITKLDETTTYGSLYNIVMRSNKPINFITIGQNVPDDIKVPTQQEIARFILGEETLC